MENIVIIGAGHAGVRAALSVRQSGFDGSITMISEEGSNAPYERPPLSNWSENASLVTQPIIGEEQLQDARIDRISGRVSSISRDAKEVVFSGENRLKYDKLLIATGANARRFPEELTSFKAIHYLRDVDDAFALREAAKSAKTAIIIGGGFIGLEVAASLRQVGVNVHILEMSDKLLERAVSSDVGQIVQDLHVKNNVKFTFDVRIKSISETGVISLENGEELQADLIVAGIGSIVETKLAEDAGLQCLNGIVVDENLRTNDPDIFAAGDCCYFPLYANSAKMTRLESWQAAGDQGTLVGQNMVQNVLEPYVQVPWFWSEQYDHILQVIGLKSPESEIVERIYDKTHHMSFGLSNENKLSFACGIAPSTKIAKDIRFASKLVEAEIVISVDELNDPSVNLKKLLRGN